MPRLRMKSVTRSNQPVKMRAPPHPFPNLQGPFEESMTELQRHEELEVPSDAASRRTILLDAPAYQRVIAGRWKQRPDEKYHPLWKIAAQLSFGIHLLAEKTAKSEDEVMQILQGHIDEVDLFLERTAEDFALAQDDVQERMRCLQLPLQHPVVFDRMLEDRAFRNSIVEGNEKIEHIVARTQAAMNDSLKDAQKGLDATASLEQYLISLETLWGRQNPDHEAVYEVMLENVEGWRAAFLDLQTQGDKLKHFLKELTGVINQMQHRAGQVSRKLARAQQKHGQSPSSSNLTFITARQSRSSAGSRSATPAKPLPGVPIRDSVRQPSRQRQRPETSQSSRSVMSQRSADAQKSRTSSREGYRSSTRDSANSRLNPKSPRIIEIKRQTPQGRELQQGSLSAGSDFSRSVTATVPPVELPAEIPRRPESNPRARVIASGLGIIESEPVEIGDNPHRLTPILAASVHDRIATPGMPLTPKSLNSNSTSNQVVAHELPSESASTHASVPSLLSSKPVGESSLGSPPDTPGWAQKTFDSVEGDGIAAGKAPFHLHTSNSNHENRIATELAKVDAQKQHARACGSVASSLGTSGPEVSSTAQSSPVKGRHIETPGINGSINRGVRPPLFRAETDESSISQATNGFVAELEGTTPVTRKPMSSASTVTRTAPREIVREVIELEVPQHQQQTSVMAQETIVLDTPIAKIIAQPVAQSHEPETPAPVSAVVVSPLELGSVEDKVATAIRRSFIATNIELADTSVGVFDPDSVTAMKAMLAKEAEQEKLQETTPAALEEELVSNPHRTSSKGVDDILEQLERLNATSPNLSLGGGQMLTLLPATTYTAKPKLPPPPAPKTSTSNLSNKIASPKSPSIKSEVGTPKSKSGRSLRNSFASNASSQSQWRAFFKGQLSPAEFNNTPSRPSKPSSAHRAIVDLQRSGQDPSPTIGWQWAPETPNIAEEDNTKTPTETPQL